MVSTSAFAEAATLVGDPARANMLVGLMDGRALTAKELAQAAGITPQTAGGHLARLTEGRLLAVEKQGRHRYHRIASTAVAHMLESIMAVAAGRGEIDRSPRQVVRVGPRDAALRRARTCYDHLAGWLAVQIADKLVAANYILLSSDGGALTAEGARFLSRLGVDLDEGMRDAGGRRGGRVFCRPCLDWSERRPHIAGFVGAAICRCCLARGWVRRLDGTRAVNVTRTGERVLAAELDLSIRR
ncbi:MAG: ArsR family transcriptional regulator [Alphaproteobacteria bacterium]|nr:ArsR family transcriptional regulator [Alphaproteobacteria bacterium]